MDNKKLVVGNWKMNGDISLCEEIYAVITKDFAKNNNVVLCPPFPFLSSLKELFAETKIKIGAQDVSDKDNGAYTGDVSASMLFEAGCAYVIIGHSERREMGEGDELVFRKFAKAKYHLSPIVCVGEDEEIYDAGKTKELLAQQLSFFAGQENIIIAYEPIWAIGTGKTPTLDEIKNITEYIRSLLPKGAKILYGGSVNDKNIVDIVTAGIDGVLVGGASLKPQVFANIITACS